MHSLLPEDYLSSQRRLAGNSCAIYLLWVSCILFHFIQFFCLSLHTLEQNLQVINYLQHITILKYSIFFFCQEAFLLPSQIHLPISATFWNENLLWIIGCTSYISIKLNEPLFQRWCRQCTLYTLPFVGPYNCLGQAQRGLFCHVQLFLDSLDIFRYAFTCSENYFLTPPESTGLQTNSKSSPNRGLD